MQYHTPAPPAASPLSRLPGLSSAFLPHSGYSAFVPTPAAPAPASRMVAPNGQHLGHSVDAELHSIPVRVVQQQQPRRAAGFSARALKRAKLEGPPRPKAKQSLGQNFLVDTHLARKIAQAVPTAGEGGEAGSAAARRPGPRPRASDT